MDLDTIKTTSKDRLKSRLKDLDRNEDAWESDQLRHELKQRGSDQD